jgi:hypothetical protein
MKELFGVSSVNDDDDAIMRSFQSYSQNIVYELEKFEIKYQSKPLPGKDVVAYGKKLLRAVGQIQSPSEFFEKIYAEWDGFLDFAEDYEPIKSFFAGEQETIFKKALGLMEIYDDSKTYIVDEQIEAMVDEIKAILKKDSPYSDIPKLPELRDRFNDLYSKLLKDMEAPVIEAIEEAKIRVSDVLDAKEYKSQFIERFRKLFAEIKEKAETCNNVATLQNVKVEADALKVRLLNEMAKKDEQIARDKAEEEKIIAGVGGVRESGVKFQPKIKKRKSISIKSVNLAASWQIETAQDVDKYMAALKERILKELDEDTIINIEF